MRKPVPDLLKGWAVLAMILVHIFELFAGEDVLLSIPGKTALFIGGPFAAPVFMTVMGYFIAASSRSKKSNVIRGLKLIILGFLLNIALNLNLLIKIFRGTFNTNPWEYIFGADILFLAGFSIIILGLLKQLARGRFYLPLILAIAVSSVHVWFGNGFADDQYLKYLQAFMWGKLEWSYFPIFPWLAYPLLGFAFYYFEGKYRKKRTFFNLPMRYILIGSLVLVSITAVFAVPEIIDLQSYYHHGLSLFLWISIFIVAWALIVLMMERKSSQLKLFTYVKWLGVNVTAVYVIQWIIIGNIATEIYKTQPLLQTILWVLVMIVAVSVISYCYLYFVSKTNRIPK